MLGEAVAALGAHRFIAGEECYRGTVRPTTGSRFMGNPIRFWVGFFV